MKVAITAGGKTLADPVSAEFSTCKYVLIVDDSNRSIDAIQKEGGMEDETLARKIIDADCEVIITGKMSAPVFERLVKAGITRYSGVGYSGEQAFCLMDQYALNLIRNLEEPGDCAPCTK